MSEDADIAPPPRDAPAVSVIVRTKDNAGTVETTLRALTEQVARPEIVVVDSGSTDGTLAIAERYADRIVHIAPGDFTFGGSLNTGAAAASADLHAALSSHSLPTDERWTERIAAVHADPRVVASMGVRRLADATPATSVFLQDHAHAAGNPRWGFSNHASSWRADVWREDPFAEDLIATEDREWAVRVLAKGDRYIAYDPDNYVPAGHRRAQGFRAYFHRHNIEAQGIASFTELPPWTPKALISDWWNNVPNDGRPKARHLVSPYRLVGLAGTHAGLRTASRQPPERRGRLAQR